jgi:hypothetical protein
VLLWNESVSQHRRAQHAKEEHAGTLQVYRAEAAGLRAELERMRALAAA